MSYKKILYLHGRPSSHPLHFSFAKSLNPDINFIDADYRWQDKGYNFFYSLLLQLLNAFKFNKYKEYEIMLIDGLHPTPIFARKLGLLNPKVKIYAHMGSHTLFFMYNKKYNHYNNIFYKYLLKAYDGFLCEGKMASDLIDQLVTNHKIKKEVTFLGPLDDKIKKLNDVNPDFNSFNIVTIADGSSEFRVYYKGLDIMLRAFAILKKQFSSLKFYIVGHWDETTQNRLIKETENEEYKEDIIFIGRTENIYKYFSLASLYLHISRGDAFPTSTIEAMNAGLPVILSEWTGTKEIIESKFPELISSLNHEDVVEKIKWYFSLNTEHKITLSNNIRDCSKMYNEKSAIDHYKVAFEKLKRSRDN